MTNSQKAAKAERKSETPKPTDEQNAEKLKTLAEKVLIEARELETRKKSHAGDLFDAIRKHDAFLDEITPSEPTSEARAS